MSLLVFVYILVFHPLPSYRYSALVCGAVIHQFYRILLNIFFPPSHLNISFLSVRNHHLNTCVFLAHVYFDEEKRLQFYTRSRMRDRVEISSWVFSTSLFYTRHSAFLFLIIVFLIWLLYISFQFSLSFSPCSRLYLFTSIYKMCARIMEEHRLMLTFDMHISSDVSPKIGLRKNGKEGTKMLHKCKNPWLTKLEWEKISTKKWENAFRNVPENVTAMAKK